MTIIHSHIVRVIAYYGLLKRPLTSLEIYKWLQCPISYMELLLALQELVDSKKITASHGYYFLPENYHLLRERSQSYVVSINKLKKARHYSRLLLMLPWVRRVAVYNSVAFFTAHEQSDIDLFIVTHPGRVWSARFFINVFLKILHLRPTQTSKRDAVCISYLRDEQHLETEDVACAWPELYPVYHHGQFIFIVGNATDFFSRNQWLHKFLPQWHRYIPNWRLRVDVSRWAQSLFEFVVTPMSEGVWRNIQLKILPEYYRVTDNCPQVKVNDLGIIKLHATKVRTDFENKYHALLASLGV